jgi:hypothetical protein
MDARNIFKGKACQNMIADLSEELLWDYTKSEHRQCNTHQDCLGLIIP